jgi:hypothetical protein
MAGQGKETEAIGAIDGARRPVQAAAPQPQVQAQVPVPAETEGPEEIEGPEETKAPVDALETTAPQAQQEDGHAAPPAEEETLELSPQAQAALAQANDAGEPQEANKAENPDEANQAEDTEEAKAKEQEDKQKDYEEKVKALELQIQDLQKQIEDLLKQGKVEEARPLVDQVGSLENEMEQLKANHPGSPDAAQGWAPQPGATIGGVGAGQQPWVPMNLGGQGNWNATPPDAFNNVQPANPNAKIPDFGPNANKKEVGQMLDAASEKYGIPPNILKAVAWQESGWNPKALSYDGQHGKGVMQIDDRFHQFARTQDVFDPKKNIDYGAKYLASLKDKYGSWNEALHHYNGGSTYAGKINSLAQQQPWNKYT